MLEADLIVHVRDIAHAETEEQARDVRSILSDLGVSEHTPQIELWNKADLVPTEERDALAQRAARHDDVYLGSAITGEGLSGLFQAMTRHLDEPRQHTDVRLGFEDGRARAWLYAQGVVEAETPDDTGLFLHVYWTERQRRAFAALDETRED